MEIVDLHPRLDARDPTVLELLALCTYPDPARLERTVLRYAAENWHLWGMVDKDNLLGLVGLNKADAEQVIITHIAVQPAMRGLGLGRHLLKLVLEQVQKSGVYTLYAETDAEAVGFYIACGFQITSLGEIYVGVERFSCHLHIP